MTDITVFDPLLDWKLRRGSHEFPGPDGGTCINEAAIVVRGLPYQRVESTDQLPACFSRPIAAYAMFINDRMDDEARQTLLPLVPRLAGSADCLDVEIERAKLIVGRVMSEVIRPYSRRNPVALACETHAILLHAAENPVSAVCSVCCLVQDTFPQLNYFPAPLPDLERAAPEPATWPAHLSILDAALKIGKQADPIETALIVSRGEAAKQRARALAAV